MTSWRQIALQAGLGAESHYDALRHRLHKRLGRGGPLQIIAYRTYGTDDRLYLKGRVLHDKGIRSARDDDNVWDNLLNMYRRMQSHEVPGARVLAVRNGHRQELVANEEGFFEAWLPVTQPAATDGDPGNRLNAAPDAEGASQGLWHTVDLELLEPRPGAQAVRATANVLVPPPAARFGVISDIDDTIVRTGAGHLLRMARTVFLGNARMRLPFEGVAAFCRALYAGASGADHNPLFYVSNSPWNMYDLFSDFFQMQDIPVGPVLVLRDWGLSHEEGLAPLGVTRFKAQNIRRILDVYPNLPFILIGDSGERDPEIYQDVVAHAPGRILAVYIRNVSTNPARVEAIHRLARQVVAAGSTLVLADNTLPLAQHAASQGWISTESLPHIAESKAADEAPPTPVEQLLGVEPTDHPQTPTVVIKDEVPSPDTIAAAVQPSSDDHK